jgi:hypothetical protein
MKRAENVIWIVLAIGVCVRAQGVLGGDSSVSAAATEPSPAPRVAGPGGADSQRSNDASFELSERLYQEALTNRPAKEVPLPNYPAGPGHPLPPHVDFYEKRTYYPDYLLCTYMVEEKHYDQSKEPAWFRDALQQIRAFGPRRFPPLKWVAVLIFNAEEPSEGRTFEQAHRVGALFRARDVFDPSSDLTQLIAHTEMDRHPFAYDPKQPTPGEQQRWLIVERHAAANPPASGSN